VAAVLLRFRHAVRHDCGRHFGSFGAGAVRGGTLSPEQARAPGSLSEEHVFSAYRGQSAASAGIGQLRNSPHEWGQGVAGYAKRFGSSMAHRAVSSTIEFGVGALRHEDPRYYHSGKQGFWPRTKYALMSTVLVHREGHEKRSVAVGRISGAVGGGLISRAWQPASSAALGLGVASAGISLGATAGFNMAREFWPDIHRHFHRGGQVAQRTTPAPRS